MNMIEPWLVEHVERAGYRFISNELEYCDTCIKICYKLMQEPKYTVWEFYKFCSLLIIYLQYQKILKARNEQIIELLNIEVVFNMIYA
jgi:hypothetical protein